MDLNALKLTLQLAVATTTILTLAGVPLAYALSRRRGLLRTLIEALVAIPLVLPPTVLGYYLLITFGAQGIVGQAYGQAFGTPLAFTFVGILVASLIVNLPFAMRPFLTAFDAIDNRWLEASWCLGRSRWETFRRITLPLATPGIVSGMVLTFAHVIGEFGVVLMVGGGIPQVTRTLSIAIYQDVQAMDHASAARTAAILVVVAIVASLATQLLARRGDRR